MNLELLRIWERDRKAAVFITYNISEAIFLSRCGDEQGPGRIIDDMIAPLPRPIGSNIGAPKTCRNSFASKRNRLRTKVQKRGDL